MLIARLQTTKKKQNTKNKIKLQKGAMSIARLQTAKKQQNSKKQKGHKMLIDPPNKSERSRDKLL
jgi:hypothetical protein